ncbi:hypothetical protein [Enterobacter sp. UPMP2052]
MSYMVSLLSSKNLNVVVLLDDEKQSRETSVELQQQGMLNRKNVVFVSDALESKREECDIEDLFNRDTFLRLVHESYDLKPATLKLNDSLSALTTGPNKPVPGPVIDLSFPAATLPPSTTQAASAWSPYHPAFATAAE